MGTDLLLRIKCVALVAPLALLSASCALVPAPVFARHVASGGYCATYPVHDPRQEQARSAETSLSAPAAEAQGYSALSLDTARALGVLSLVDRLARAQGKTGTEAEIADLRGEINDAITVAMLDLESTVSHVECEAARAREIGADLRDADDQGTDRLTASSLVITAGASIATGVLAMTTERQTATGVVGIAGGVAGGALGFAAFAVRHTTYFRHAPNILRELWYGEAHPDLPEAVWTYLTSPQFVTEKHHSVRENLVQSWKESGRLGDDPSHVSPDRIALYFGEGGEYDANGLDDRLDMLGEVHSAIKLMNHALQRLATDVAAH